MARTSALTAFACSAWGLHGFAPCLVRHAVEAETTSLVYARCRVTESRADERGVWMTVRGPAAALAQVREKVKVYA